MRTYPATVSGVSLAGPTRRPCRPRTVSDRFATRSA